MSNAAWKKLERRVCRALGAERSGPLGKGCSDCTDEAPFSVEVKRTTRLTLRADWIAQARSHSLKERKPWLLVQSTHGSPRPLVTLDFWVFAEIAQKAGLIGEVSIGEDEEAA